MRDLNYESLECTEGEYQEFIFITQDRCLKQSVLKPTWADRILDIVLYAILNCS